MAVVRGKLVRRERGEERKRRRRRKRRGGRRGDTEKREIGNWELGIDGLPGRGWDSSRKETD